MESFKIGIVAFLLALACRRLPMGDAAEFSEVINVIEEKRLELSKHKFFAMLGDESIPATKRMSFTPYWTFFAMEFADILDSWVWIENPKNELERRINAFVQEDNFHYNFLLHDAEEILGFTLDRYGSYAGVMRHVWGDETKAIRQLMYSWIAWAKKTDDPMIVLTTFEAMEAGLKDLFEVAYAKVFLPAEGELKFLEYFGKTHVELEVNHTVTSWFKEGEQPYRPLSEISVTEETKSLALEVVEDIFEK